MYCERCSPVREKARRSLSHIVDTIYLSDMDAASTFQGDRICVHELGPRYEGQCHFMPILTTTPNSKMDRSGGVASLKALDDVADLLHEYVIDQRDVLIHCVGGIERSPLALAWYLVKVAKKFDTLQEAYNFMKLKRPVVSERLFWLPDGIAE